MDSERQAKLNTALDQILRALITNYQPEKVILFGSMARSDVSEWSDVDLVIVKETPLPFLQRSKAVALLCLVPVSVDYLVYTPDEFDQMVAERNPFIVDEVLGKGKVIYERQPAEAVAR